MFHVGTKNLETAFNRHRNIGSVPIPNDTHVLLLLYAAECGLKRLLLKQRGLHSTSRLEDDDLTHDLNMLLKKLGSRELFGQCAAEPGGISVSAERFHEVLRYGGRFSEEKRTDILQRVTSVVKWIEEALG